VAKSVRTQHLRSGRPLTLVAVTDGTGTIEARWFNEPYLAQRLAVGAEIAMSGRVSEYLGRLVFVSPEWEPLERDLLNTNGLIPVYPLTGGVPLRWLRRLVKGALDLWVPSLVDPLPVDLRRSAGLMELGSALEQAHFRPRKRSWPRPASVCASTSCSCCNWAFCAAARIGRRSAAGPSRWPRPASASSWPACPSP
jgi:RecG-like helicase